MAEMQQAEMLRYWVWLSMVFGAGSSKLIQYLRKYETPDALYDAIQAGMIPDLPLPVQKAMTKHTLSEADGIVYYCRQHEIALLPVTSPDYPEMLRSISLPPALLTAKGNLDLLRNPLTVSVVGTRHPSPYTERVLDAVLRELLKSPFTVVSGFAKGVDGLVHQTVLDCGGGTIGVLGCGINVNYPREHTALRERMLTSGNGLLISEYLPGTQPFPANFPRRNRILSGLGYAAVVMEGTARSGSLVTAQCAAEQGKYLFAVPPADLFDARYSGNVRLLRDGAIPLMSAKDLLLVFYERCPQFISLQEDAPAPSERLFFADEPAAQQGSAQALPEQVPERIAPKNADEPATQPVPTQSAPEADGPLPESEEGQQIVRYLRSHGPTHVNDLAAALDLDLSLVLGTLTLLELDGFAESVFGKQYRAL